MDVQGRIAVVTGAASGIGQATAEALAAAGAMVIIADINVEKGQAVARSLRDKAQQADYFKVDVTNDASSSSRSISSVP